MPRLVCTFRRFLEILTDHGFVLHHQGSGSHRRYRAVIGGEVRLVDFAAHNLNDEIRTGTLKSMIRQSGLKEGLFRK